MPKEPGEPNFEEQEKSPEELRYEKLRDEASHLPLDNEVYDGVKVEGLRDKFYLSGDPEKIAIFYMKEIREKLDFLAAKERARGGKKDKRLDKQIAELRDQLETSLSDAGLEVPQKLGEASTMRENFSTFENWQKITQAVEKRQNEE